MFLTELAFVSAMLAGLGLAGGFVVLPLWRRLPFAILAAPLAGLLCVVLGTAALYSVVNLPCAFCAAASAFVCISITIVSYALWGARPNWRQTGWGLAAATAATLIITWATNANSIRAGNPVLLYRDGSDHLGYAHLADWLNDHLAGDPPQHLNWSAYGEWPAFLFRRDPRFGSFFCLAIVSLARGLSGTFSYDSGCAVVLAASVLGLCGAFARSTASLLLLLSGLLASHWYDYGRIGFFGKSIGYPSALLLIGLFLHLPDRPALARVCVLSGIAAAAALTFSGLVTAMLLLVVVVPYLAAQSMWNPSSAMGPRSNRWDLAAVMALLAGVAVVTTGVLARPLYQPTPDYGVQWDYILPRILDLENQGTFVTGFSSAGVRWLSVAALGLWVVLAGAAVLQRNAAAVGLLIGPLLLLLGLAAVGAKAPAFQLIGLLYPLSLCGAAWLLDGMRIDATAKPTRVWRSRRAAAIALTALMVLVRVPRAVGAYQRYAGANTPEFERYSKAETDRLLAAIHRRPVEVDFIAVQPAVYAVVELERDGVPLRWTSRGWKTIAWYSKRNSPEYLTPPRLQLRLVTDPLAPSARVLCRTAQFQLVDPNLPTGGR